MAQFKRKKQPKTTADYLKVARSFRAAVPSLTKYNRRRSLRPQEKSAITRAMNKVVRAGRGGTVVPLTKQQAKRLKSKDPLIGNGIRAVRLRQTSLERAKVSVKDGELRVRQNGRVWHYVPLPPDVKIVVEETEDIFNRNSGKTVRLTIWTAAGRLPVTRAELQDALDFLVEFFETYQSLDPAFDDWFLGLAYFVER